MGGPRLLSAPQALLLLLLTHIPWAGTNSHSQDELPVCSPAHHHPSD